MLLFLSGAAAEFVVLECMEDSIAVVLGGVAWLGVVEGCHASQALLLLAGMTGFDPIPGV